MPARLSETGLYASVAKKVLAPEVRSYSPQYPLWSDGARKARWVWLPAASRIDARDPDRWVFPLGTRFWKEFSFNGHRIETRVMEKEPAGHWAYATYAWNADETEAVLVPPTGQPHVATIADGVSHDLPSIEDCKACHEGAGREAVLGFTALQLSSDRDPGAPHAEPLLAGMLDLAALVREDRVAHAPAQWAQHPPGIPARSPRERSAVGYLLANCGGCHNPEDAIAALNLSVTSAPKGPTIAQWASAVRKPSSFQIPDLALGLSTLIEPGRPEASALVFRMATREPLYQMPPLGTNLVDTQAVKLVSEWIRLDLPAQGRSAQPNERLEHP
jgi:hypothetical protein